MTAPILAGYEDDTYTVIYLLRGGDINGDILYYDKAVSRNHKGVWSESVASVYWRICRSMNECNLYVSSEYFQRRNPV